MAPLPVVPTIPHIGKATPHGVTPGPGDVFAVDTFNDTDGTVLTDHSGWFQAVWTKHAASTTGANADVIRNNRLSHESTGLSMYYASGLPLTPDYWVLAPLLLLTDNDSLLAGVVGRLDAVADTCYCARYNLVTGAYELVKVIAGVETVLGSSVQPVGNSTQLILQVDGDQIRLLLDFLPVIGPITDTDITDAGRVGVRFDGTATSNTGIQMTVFVAQNA